MTGPSHIVFAMLGYVLATRVPDMAPLLGDPSVELGAVALIAGLLPDIDSEQSIAGQAAGPFGYIAQKITVHRGFTHSFVCLSMLAWLAYRFLSLPVAMAAVIGYASHLLGDFLTPSGLQLFWPLDWRPRLPIGLLTGGPVEDWLAGMMLVVLMLLGFRII